MTAKIKLNAASGGGSFSLQAQEVMNQCKTRFTEIQAILKDRQEDTTES